MPGLWFRYSFCLFVLCLALRNHLCTFTCQGSDSAGITAASRSTIGMRKGAIYGFPSVQSYSTCPDSWLARTPPDPSAGTIGNWCRGRAQHFLYITACGLLAVGTTKLRWATVVGQDVRGYTKQINKTLFPSSQQYNRPAGLVTNNPKTWPGVGPHPS